MAEQTIPIPAARWLVAAGEVHYRYTSERPAISASLSPPDAATRYLRDIVFLSNGTVKASFDTVASGGEESGRSDLGSGFESGGSITLTVGDHSITIETDHDEKTDPYTFTPSNAAEVIAFVQAVQPGGAMDGTLVLRDFVPAPAVAVVHDRSASFALGAPGFSAVVGKTVHTGVSLNTIPVQAGTELGGRPTSIAKEYA